MGKHLVKTILESVLRALINNSKTYGIRLDPTESGKGKLLGYISAKKREISVVKDTKRK